VVRGAVPVDARVALTLKLVAGLSTESIARAVRGPGAAFQHAPKLTSNEAERAHIRARASSA
jgi:predicted RNA polymerase sigma factor